MILNDDKITSSSASGITIDKSLVFDGSPNSPGISFVNEPSSGIYRISAGVLGIAIGGNRVAQIDSFGIQAGQPYWNIVEQQANGVAPNPSTSVSTTWTARTLNTTIGPNTITGSSLIGNQFTLPAGAYRISALSYFTSGNVKLRLRNISDGTTTLLGINSNTTTAQSSSIHPTLVGRFSIASPKVFELQYWVNGAIANGLGYAMSSGEPETYTIIELWKVA